MAALPQLAYRGDRAGSDDITRHRAVTAPSSPSFDDVRHLATRVIQAGRLRDETTLVKSGSLSSLCHYQSITSDTSAEKPTPVTVRCRTSLDDIAAKLADSRSLSPSPPEKREKSLRRATKNLVARTCLQMEALAVISYQRDVTQESVVNRVCELVDIVNGLFS